MPGICGIAQRLPGSDELQPVLAAMPAPELGRPWRLAAAVCLSAGARPSEAVGFCKAEVDQFHYAVWRDLDVGGLKVAVNNALGMRSLQTCGNLPRNGDCIRRRHLSTPNTVRKSFAFDQLEHQATQAIGLLDPVD